MLDVRAKEVLMTNPDIRGDRVGPLADRADGGECVFAKERNRERYSHCYLCLSLIV